MTIVRLFIIESRATLGQGLRLRIDAEPDLQVIGDAPDCLSALPRLSALRPAVVLVDIDCPKWDHRECATPVCQVAGRASLIILTLQDNAQTECFAARVGAAAVVIKSLPTETLLTAIREASHAS